MCGKSNQMSGNDKSKINCQCDGNCDCGEVLPNGDISCDNCGWKAPQAYSALTGNYTCPTCRTESSYSSNNKPKSKSNISNNKFKNNDMNNNKNSNLSQGMVGLAAVNAGFLNWSDEPLGTNKNSPESSFANDISSQNMVGYAMGQEWTPMNPFGNGGQGMTEENKKWARIFYNASSEFDKADAMNNESGLLGDKLKDFVTRFTPTGIVIRQSWSAKYCKSLGYLRSADKTGYKKCMASTKINFTKAKNGKWKYPAAPEGIEEDLSPEELAALSAQEIATMTPEQKNSYTNQAVVEDSKIAGSGTTPKNNTILYVVIGFVVLAIIVAIIIMMRKRAAAKA